MSRHTESCWWRLDYSCLLRYFKGGLWTTCLDRCALRSTRMLTGCECSLRCQLGLVICRRRVSIFILSCSRCKRRASSLMLRGRQSILLFRFVCSTMCSDHINLVRQLLDHELSLYMLLWSLPGLGLLLSLPCNTPLLVDATRHVLHHPVQFAIDSLLHLFLVQSSRDLAQSILHLCAGVLYVCFGSHA